MLSFCAVIKGAVLRGAPSVVNPSCRSMFSLYSFKTQESDILSERVANNAEKARSK